MSHGDNTDSDERLDPKYELLTRASTDAFWDWDPKTDEITRSEDYLAAFGYTASDVASTTDWWRERIHPDDRARVLAALRAAVEDPGTTYDETYRLRKKDGSYGYVRSRGYVVYDENGAPERMLGAHIDVTDREERERIITSLHTATRGMIRAETRSEVAEIAVEAARDIVELPHTAIQLYDAEEDVLRPVAFTDSVEELLGTVPTIEPESSIIWRAFSTGEVEVNDDVRTDSDVMNPDTDVRSQIILPLDTHGVLICNSAETGDFQQIDVKLARVLAENTRAALDRIEHEQTLRRQTQQLEQQNEHLERVTRVLSHDLRNPLNVAKGRLELARENHESDDLLRVGGALTRIEEIVENTLLLAEQGSTVRSTGSIDLTDLACRCWNDVKTSDATVDVVADVTIRGDPDRLPHVFENLFRNAVDHGGETVSIRVGPTDEDGFYVADDGPGIPEDDRETVFDLGHSTTDDGTGFGLAIVEEIVEAHGWEIDVTDARNGGARFEITGVDRV